jgi:putative glutamine amidotransferase
VSSTPPRIVITVSDASLQPDPSLARRRIALYAEAVRRAGGEAIVLHPSVDRAVRGEVLASMDGVLFAGGADIDPARYGHPGTGSRDVEPDRDALEEEAWRVAEDDGLPVLGICRGFQAINVFAGGSLVQHVDGHEGPGWGLGPTRSHPIRLEGASQLADLVGGDSNELVVNTFHHQAVSAAGLAPGLRASAWAGDLVEGLEAPGVRFVVGVQCHPERVDSTPPAFERLFQAFVDAARTPARGAPPRSRAGGTVASAARGAR